MAENLSLGQIVPKSPELTEGLFLMDGMATAKSMKIQAEIDKVKAKISDQQARLKELEQKKLEAENSEIVDIVRGMSIPLAELPLLFEKLKGDGALGQSVPKSEPGGKEEN